MKSLRGKHKGETAWIIGKGSSLQYLTADDIGSGPVNTINQAIEKVETLELDNPIYSLQKNGGPKRTNIPGNNLSPNCEDVCEDVCGNMTKPKDATLIVHNLESFYCFDDYSQRYVFKLEDFGLTQNTCSFVIAIKMGQLFGCDSFNFISFDAHVFGCEKYANQPYVHQIAEVKPHYADLNVKWITPSVKEAA